MTTPSPARRDFLRALLRGALLAGIGLFTVQLFRHRRVCTRRGDCKGCSDYTACTLPEKEVRP